jgi:hypothetical protein
MVNNFYVKATERLPNPHLTAAEPVWTEMQLHEKGSNRTK